jgi:hypothetical protein
MGKTFRRGGSEQGYYSYGKSIRDKRQTKMVIKKIEHETKRELNNERSKRNRSE